jgi:DNA-directed RNA polymerase specialized sigma24 family protein
MDSMVILAMGAPKPKNAIPVDAARRKPPQPERSATYARQASPDPALAPYRGRTTAILRRYARLAVQQGRLPSIVGRDFFRARTSSWQVHTFEDDVIFTFDVERCLQQLEPLSQAVLARVVLEEYSPDDAAFLLHVARATVFRKLGEALDRLSEIMLRRELLRPFPGDEHWRCQEAKNVISLESYSRRSR